MSTNPVHWLNRGEVEQLESCTAVLENRQFSSLLAAGEPVPDMPAIIGFDSYRNPHSGQVAVVNATGQDIHVEAERYDGHVEYRSTAQEGAPKGYWRDNTDDGYDSVVMSDPLLRAPPKEMGVGAACVGVWKFNSNLALTLTGNGVPGGPICVMVEAGPPACGARVLTQEQHPFSRDWLSAPLELGRYQTSFSTAVSVDGVFQQGSRVVDQGFGADTIEACWCGYVSAIVWVR